MRLVTLVVLGSLPLMATAESWLCIPDSTTGFHYEKAIKKWVDRKFTADEKFVVRASTLPEVKWEVVEMGDKVPSAICRDDFSKSGVIQCSLVGQFEFNKTLLKFVYTSTYGYFLDPKESPEGQPDSVYVSVGRCTAI